MIEQSLTGWIGNDLVMRYTPKGQAVTNFSMSLPAGKEKNEDGTERKLYTYVKVSCWNELAEDVNENYKSGDLVQVWGQLIADKPYESKSKEMKSSIKFTAFKIEHVK